VRELLIAGRRPVRDVWISESADAGDIAELAEGAGVPVRLVSRGRLDAEARTDAPQGVLAHARELAEVPLDELCGGPATFLVVVDGVTDPQNLGALLRTAEVAGATGVVLPRHRAAHVTPAVTKAAAGAIEYLPISVVAGIPSALRQLSAAGVWTVGLDPDADRPVWDLGVATEGLALVLGAEGAGLSRLARERCDVLVGIPQIGRLGSLNVAAAGAVAMFEVARVRGAQ
jgi:23S rRNA (guanosine2251-2'-O)-methyltransferase